MKKFTTLATIGLTAVILAGSGTAAVAARDGDVFGTSTCSVGVKGKLKAGVRDGRVDDQFIKVQLDVDDRAAGVWTAKANGVAMRRVTAPTAANGFQSEFVVFLPNKAGADAITVAAAAPNRTCTGRVTV